MANLPPPPQVMRQYQEIMQESQKIMSKVAELETQHNEHKLVEETLKPLDPDRRAFRLVGEVLVERTVKEVLPSISSNKENLEKAIAALKQRLETKQKEAGELKAKYNIRTEASR